MRNKNKTPGDYPLAGARLIVVIATLELGGAERQAILLAQHLAHEQKANVEVWGYGEPGRAAKLCDEVGVAWRSAPIPLPWSNDRLTQSRRLARFARALRRANPDVILPFMFMPSVACGLIWRSTGARLCIWNQRCEGRDRLGPLTEKLAVKFTPVFVANSQHGAEFMIRELLVDPARLHIIHNGVQLARAQGNRETWRNSLAVDDSCFLACMVANLQMYKDHVTLLKAWRIVVDRLRSLNREAVLLLAGRFDETHDRLKALAYDLDLGSSVRFLGSVKDVTGLLEAVDIGVHSSVNEGCPNGVLECMAAGLAVVGTNYAGIREALGSGYEFLAEPGDAAGFAEQVIRLAQDPRARREAGEANALRIGAEFQPEHMYQKMVALIAEALHALPAATPISTGAAMLAENHEGR